MRLGSIYMHIACPPPHVTNLVFILWSASTLGHDKKNHLTIRPVLVDLFITCNLEAGLSSRERVQLMERMEQLPAN